MKQQHRNSMGTAIDELLPDDHIFTEAEKEAIEDLVWTGYFLNHRDPGPAVWELHELISNEQRATKRGRKPTVGEIRELLRRDEEECHVGFYRTTSDTLLYDAEGCGMVSAAAVKANDPERYELLVRRRDHFAQTGTLPDF
jgi:hypothetical protein